MSDTGDVKTTELTIEAMRTSKLELDIFGRAKIVHRRIGSKLVLHGVSTPSGYASKVFHNRLNYF